MVWAGSIALQSAGEENYFFYIHLITSSRITGFKFDDNCVFGIEHWISDMNTTKCTIVFKACNS